MISCARFKVLINNILNMKNYTLGVFSSPEQADAAVNTIHSDLSVPSDSISYLYKDKDGAIVADADGSAPMEGAASGAAIGGAVGAGLGLATVAGLIPVIGPIFAAGPLIAALGIGGAVGTTAAGALTGAATGGLVGGLLGLGISEPEAKEYESQVSSGNVLLAVEADEAVDIASVFSRMGGTNIHSYKIS